MNAVLGTLSAVFWIALITAIAAAKPVYSALLAFKSRQIVSEYVPEHSGKQGTPTMGGIITGIAFVTSCIVAVLLRLVNGPLVSACLLVYLGFALVGFTDDYIVPKAIQGKRGLGWKQKFALEILFAALAVALAWGGHFSIGAYVAVFLVLFYSNAYNFVDGMDGLAGVVLLLFAGGLIALGVLQFRPSDVLVPCAALIGGIIPFLFLNAPPAKVFMGDVGALPIGAVLGLVVSAMLRPIVIVSPDAAQIVNLYSYQPMMTVAKSALPLALMSLVFLAELVPVPLQVASVKLRKKRLFPMTPIHHAFQKAGWPESRVVWYFGLAQLLCEAMGLCMALGGPPR